MGSGSELEPSEPDVKPRVWRVGLRAAQAVMGSLDDGVVFVVVLVVVVANVGWCPYTYASV